MVNLEKAEKIFGWMNREEMTFLAEHAQHGEVVEIGSWQGRSTRAMADNKLDGHIYAVDTFMGSADDTQYYLKDKPESWLFDQFRENLADHIASGLVVPMRMRSTVAAAYAQVSGTKFDMVFIDGAHDFESVRSDILAWRPLIKDGGLLSGHDFDWGFPGTVHAVKELVAEVPHQVNGTSLWYTNVSL